MGAGFCNYFCEVGRTSQTDNPIINKKDKGDHINPKLGLCPIAISHHIWCIQYGRRFRMKPGLGEILTEHNMILQYHKVFWQVNLSGTYCHSQFTTIQYAISLHEIDCHSTI